MVGLVVLAALVTRASADPAVAERARASDPATDPAADADPDDTLVDDAIDRRDLANAPDDELALEPYVIVGTALVDPVEVVDVAARHHRPSSWGRLDLSVSWRRRWKTSTALDLAAGAHARHADVVWLFATWRR